ncbi:MAG: 2-oxo acid dehydrogenase subunit E2 [Alphaproteobacteria bacterium]|nr:2-oxo acid dehydrogenase subunit E2 [Alphaproteobacteria bacterium]
MGRYVFKLPDVGEGTAEAEIVAWHVAIGDKVKQDQQLVDVMTDKATVEMTSPVSGTVVSLTGQPGEMAAVGAPLVEFELEGCETSNGKGAHAPMKSAEAPKRVAERLEQTDKKALASPAVRLRASELGVPLNQVKGTGPGGRVTHGDVDDYIAGGSKPAAKAAEPARSSREEVFEIKIIGLRRRIAEKMQEAKRRIPHFAYIEEVDMTELESLRTHLNATRKPKQPKLTVLPFLMRALVRVLPDFPQINAHYDDDAGVVRRFASVHFGIATQTNAGLIVPVVRNGEKRDLWNAAAEVARLAVLARDGKAGKEDLTGSTITITSLGPLGGVATTPIINHPEVAIIGPNAIIERPVVRDGQITVRKMMNLSSCFDHRVVDGADAAAFIQRVKALLEHPALLFME